MRGLLLLLMMMGAMTAAWIATSGLRTPSEIDKALTTASIPAPQPLIRSDLHVFTLSSADSSGSCMVVKGETLSPGYSELTVNPACEGILPGLTTARFWRERADGSIAFVDTQNSSVVEFTIGDGSDFESYQPRTARLSMWAE